MFTKDIDPWTLTREKKCDIPLGGSSLHDLGNCSRHSRTIPLHISAGE